MASRTTLADATAAGVCVRGVTCVLQKLDRQICECLEHAARADERVANETNPDIRGEYVELARKWRTLARSFEFAIALEQFLLDGRKGETASPPEAPD